MPSLRDFLLTTLNEVEHVIDMHTFYVKRSLNLLDPLMIQPYLGFGNATQVTLQGRLLENEGIETPRQGASSWQNFKTMVHRYGSDEIPHARIRAIFGDQEQVIETDAEGYFRVTFTGFTLPPADRIWYPMDLELLDSFHGQQETVKATGQVIIPQKSEFGVISDVDDTILVSHSADFVKKIQLTFMHNAKTRVPFEGVASFYQALHQGSDRQHANPIFYVSSSPWNLYDLLKHFCEVHKIPKGPYMLRDIGLTDQHFIRSSHEKHKVAQITQIFDTYPDMKFILVGDSGQKDPEIYEGLTDQYAGSILGIYIRDVTHDARDQEVRQIAECVRERGIDMILAYDTLEAAHHAVENQWIHADCVDEIAAQVQRDHQYNA